MNIFLSIVMVIFAILSGWFGRIVLLEADHGGVEGYTFFIKAALAICFFVAMLAMVILWFR